MRKYKYPYNGPSVSEVKQRTQGEEGLWNCLVTTGVWILFWRSQGPTVGVNRILAGPFGRMNTSDRGSLLPLNAHFPLLPWSQNTHYQEGIFIKATEPSHHCC